ETIKKTEYAVRDFCVSKDTIYYIEHRDIHVENTDTKVESSFFIGGYGLEMFNLNSNEIITTSNELVQNVSSFRFYQKNANEVKEVYYYKKGRTIDFLKIPDKNIFAFSSTDKKITFINFDNRPIFKKEVEINLNSYSRKLIFKNNNLYFITDLGDIYKYDLSNNKKELLYKANEILTDFYVDEQTIIYTTISGKISKINLKNNKLQTLNINRNFIVNVLYSNNKLICGSWKGDIFVIDINKFKITKELKYHNSTVLKILNYKDNVFYSSSIDKTIKKWYLN
ncbi:MAG: hypothetical protein KDC67_16385, partial [Ignavibacteriae bacterium]|nr:hypothetical protein [Ignavibacteriota bacterium]